MESKDSLLFRLTELENDKQRYFERIQQLENDSRKAAELGLELLESNKRIEEERDNIKREYFDENEKLKEENFILSKRVEEKISSQKNFDSEIESVQSRFYLEKAQCIQQCKDNYESQSAILHRKIDGLERELKQRDRSYESTVSELERAKRDAERIQRHPSYLSDDSLESSTRNNTVDDLRLDLGKATTDKECLEEEMKSLVREFAQLNDQNKDLLQSLEIAQEQATGFKASCDEYKVQFEDMQDEIATLKSELMTEGGCRNKKGNSMFSELNDQRIKVETNLSNMSARYNDMKKENEELKKEVTRLKRQLTTALQMQSSTCGTNIAEVQSLQNEVSRLRGELRAKTAQLTSARQSSIGVRESSDLFAATAMTQPDRMLKEMLNHAQKEIKTVRAEADTARVERAMCQDQLIREQTHKSQVQRELAEIKNECGRLKMQLEEVNDRKRDKQKQHQRITREEVIVATNVVQPGTSSNTVVKEEKPVSKQMKEVIRSNSIRLSDEVTIVGADGEIVWETMKENQNPTKLTKERKSAGRKVHSGIGEVVDAKPAMDTSVDECKQQ